MNILFEGHPLGHNILGKAEQLRTYTTKDALRFVHRYYRPDNAIFFAYGDIDFKRLVKSLEFRIESLEFATAIPETKGRSNSPLSTLNSQLITTRHAWHTGLRYSSSTSHTSLPS